MVSQVLPGLNGQITVNQEDNDPKLVLWVPLEDSLFRLKYHLQLEPSKLTCDEAAVRRRESIRLRAATYLMIRLIGSQKKYPLAFSPYKNLSKPCRAQTGSRP